MDWHQKDIDEILKELSSSRSGFPNFRGMKGFRGTARISSKRKRRGVLLRCCSISSRTSGRWHYRSRKFSSGKSNLYADLRKKKAKSVYFNLKKNASYRSDQSEIWDAINEKTAEFSVNSETHAMNDIYDSYEDKIGVYEKQLKIITDQIG